MELPSVSIIIPTLNSSNVLPACLKSIRNQDYPREKIEILVIDAGSVDTTIQIAKKYETDKILKNLLKTGEAGKAAGIKVAKNEILALIDSDNILPRTDWLRRMVEPLEDEEIVGTEPLYYTYNKQDSYITRYCALLGMNDPLCLFLGNYDRLCYITNRWTEIQLKEVDMSKYLKVELNVQKLPTMGANGFLFRRELLEAYSFKNYFFDIDLVYELVRHGHTKFAKVKIGIIHIFSGSSGIFLKKQIRRIRDFLYYSKQGLRKYPWNSIATTRSLRFLLCTILIVPLFIQALRGYFQKRDRVWFFHILACWITLFAYAIGMIESVFKSRPQDRREW